MNQKSEIRNRKSPDLRWWKSKRVLVTGADGFIGQRVVSLLVEQGLVPASHIRQFSLPDGDLRSPADARWAVAGSDVVLHLAADVGGLGYSTTHSADQYHNCSAIDLSIVEAARHASVSRIMLVGCSTSYPSTAPSPLVERDLFAGVPRETHLGYGLAKRNAIALAMLYARQHGMSISAIVPNNTYGPGDHFDETSHVVAAIIAKCCSAGPRLDVWGDGTPVRDFVYVDDVVTGLLLAAEHLAAGSFVNIGSGTETSIATLVEIIVRETGFTGPVVYDSSKPGGEPRRSLEISKAMKEIGYAPQIGLEVGLRRTIDWYRDHQPPTANQQPR
jgi:GDP-L-fucose synthase